MSEKPFVVVPLSKQGGVDESVDELVILWGARMGMLMNSKHCSTYVGLNIKVIYGIAAVYIHL